MAKPKAPRKKSNSDVQVTVIIIGLLAIVVLFFVIHKNKPSSSERTKPAASVHASVRGKKVPAEREEQEEQEQQEVAQVQPSPQAEPVVRRAPGSAGKIAFILDDWGQTTSNCRYLKEIPEPMAVSILPGLRHTKDVAECANPYNKLVMLHLPLQALYNHDPYPKDYIITTTMPAGKVQRIVEEDLAQIPYVEGVNNHMGSKATGDRALMRTIFKVLKKKGLFYVDSVTVRNSVCPGLAEELDLPFGKRDVFLDNINTREAIVKQLHALAVKARDKGYAVAIGHDRHLTMQVLKEQIPVLEQQGFTIVSIKSLIRKR